MAQACVMAPPRPQDQLLTPGKQPLSPQLDNSLITSTVRKRKVDAGETPHPQLQAPAHEEGKRQRTPSVDRGLADGDGSVHLLVSPAAIKGPAAAPDRQQPQQHSAEAEAEQERQQQPGPSQHQREQQQTEEGAAPGGAQHQQQEEEAALFSPLFHLHKDGSRDDLSAHSVGEVLQLDAPADAATAGALPAVQAVQQQAQQGQAARRQDTENASTDRSTGTSASLADPDSSSADAASRPAVASPPPAAAAAAACQQEEAAAAQQQQAAEEEGEEYLEFDPLLFIKRLPPLECCVPPRRDFLLPKRTRRSKQKTLVLDLDETLVHSTLDGYCRPDFTFPVEVGSLRHMVSVRRRPHLHTFLERVAQLYEVVVFTASQRVYAEQLLNIVDPERRLVRHRVYRDSCVFWEGNYLKDLTVLGRDLAHTIIVDNSPQAFGFQLDNGIPIESWYDDDGDQELLKLIPFLEQVAHAEDVRPHIQRRYRLRSLVDAAADPDTQAYQLLQQH